MLVSPDAITFASQTQLNGFIVVEGVNGAGKSTFIRLLNDYLIQHGRKACLTFEPGATTAGAKIRELVLSPAEQKLDPLTEILLFAADRRENVIKIIWPAIRAGIPVISDRYIYSTLAFQGYGRGMELSEIETIMHLATGGLIPDMVILLDLDPLEGLRRAAKRTSIEQDSFEHEEIQFHTRLRHGFQELARQRPEPFIELDARCEPGQLLNMVKSAIVRWMKAASRDADT